MFFLLVVYFLIQMLDTSRLVEFCGYFLWELRIFWEFCESRAFRIKLH